MHNNSMLLDKFCSSNGIANLVYYESNNVIYESNNVIFEHVNEIVLQENSES